MPKDEEGKKTSKAKSKSEQMRDLREKQAAKAKKKQPKPNKPTPPKKPEPAKKAAEGEDKSDVRPVKVGEPELITPADLQARKESASALIVSLKVHMREHFHTQDALKAQRAVIDAEVVALQRDAAWRFAEVSHEDGFIGPYASWTACVKDLIAASGKSRAIVMGIISLAKAVPQLSSNERAAMGPRKGAKVAAAAREAEAQGREVPPGVIASAQKTETSEDDLVSEIESAGLGPKVEPRVDDRQESFPMPEAAPGPKEDKPDPLLATTAKGKESLRNGGSGAVEGRHGTAAQFGGKLLQAAMQYATLYDDSAGEPLTQMELLERVCEMFGDTEIDEERILDDSMRENLLTAARALPVGGIMTNRKAFEYLMHQPRKATSA